MSFEQKYLKYKSKYLALKSQLSNYNDTRISVFLLYEMARKEITIV